MTHLCLDTQINALAVDRDLFQRQLSLAEIRLNELLSPTFSKGRLEGAGVQSADKQAITYPNRHQKLISAATPVARPSLFSHFGNSVVGDSIARSKA